MNDTFNNFENSKTVPYLKAAVISWTVMESTRLRSEMKGSLLLTEIARHRVLTI